MHPSRQLAPYPRLIGLLLESAPLMDSESLYSRKLNWIVGTSRGARIIAIFVNNMCDAAMYLLKLVLDFGEYKADSMDIHCYTLSWMRWLKSFDDTGGEATNSEFSDP